MRVRLAFWVTRIGLEGQGAMQPRIVELRTKILKKNDELARQMRSDFARSGAFVVNVVSGPGAGKTELLTRTLGLLGVHYRVAAVVGDLATENDAQRLGTSGARVKQILTGTMCHLEAEMVRAALGEWPADSYDFLFIENVGNLVCPASWDLGEDLRVLLLSVTEGEDKPLKYTTLINTADVAVVSKTDLAAAVGFDAELARRNIQQARPGIPMLEVSARTGLGMASGSISWKAACSTSEEAKLAAGERRPVALWNCEAVHSRRPSTRPQPRFGLSIGLLAKGALRCTWETEPSRRNVAWSRWALPRWEREWPSSRLELAGSTAREREPPAPWAPPCLPRNCSTSRSCPIAPYI